MKLHRNIDGIFVVLFLVTALLSPFWSGVRGQDWMRTYLPYVRIFLAISYLALGPWIISSSLEARSSEKPVTIWKKTWPCTFGLGILSILAGIAALWALFVMK